MVIREAVNRVREYITRSDNPAFEAKQLVMFAAGTDDKALILNPNMRVDFEKVKELARRRQSGEPLQYIMGSAEFMSLDFEVCPDVLIPRIDTEALVELAIEKIGERKADVLDIGAGSGCVGISIAHYCRKTNVSFVDISAAALEIAKKNAARHGISARFYNMDVLKDFPKGKFDVIVSNPPYIRSEDIDTLHAEVRDFEPKTALDGGEDGLKFYRRITDAATQHLFSDGLLIYEIGFDQAKAVYNMVSERFSDAGIVKDLCGNDRVVWGKTPIF